MIDDVDRLIDQIAAFDDELLALMTEAERAEYDRACAVAAAGTARAHEDDWSKWLRLMFPDYFRAPFAAHHAQLWSWVWALELDVRPPAAMVDVWPRGGAKSTSAEAAVAGLGARRRRRFVLYVCETQTQADGHVQNIATLLESPYLGMAYPELGARAVGKYGEVKGWRRNRLRTASGLTVDALGLDTAARGIKVDDVRPDLIVFDDIDSEHDGPGQVEAKREAFTEKLLPAGGPSLAVLVIQNIPNPAGIVAELAGVAEMPAEYLRDRIVVGPVPAVEDAAFERGDDGGWKIVGGRATWEGQSLERCQEQIDEWGITAFRKEAQHETDARGGGMFDHIDYRHCARADVPDLVRTVVWVDPAVTTTDDSDSHAIQCDGIDTAGVIYRLRSWERRATPVGSLKLAIVIALAEGAAKVGVEVDQGHDTWHSVWREAQAAVAEDLKTVDDGGQLDELAIYVTTLAALTDDPLDRLWRLQFDERKAGVTQMSKAARASQMLVDYEARGRIVHVLGDHLILERALNRFPRTKPFDLTDASYWSWRDLRRDSGARVLGARTVAAARLPSVTTGRAGGFR